MGMFVQDFLSVNGLSPSEFSRTVNILTLFCSFFFTSQPHPRHATDRAIQQINNPQREPIAHHTLCRVSEEIRKKKHCVNSSFSSGNPPSDGGHLVNQLQQQGRTGPPVEHTFLLPNMFFAFMYFSLLMMLIYFKFRFTTTKPVSLKTHGMQSDIQICGILGYSTIQFDRYVSRFGRNPLLMSSGYGKETNLANCATSYPTKS